MIEVLEFIFRDFWTWLGTLFLIVAIPMPFRIVINHKSGKKVAEREDESE